MRLVRHTLIDSVHAECPLVFALLTDPARMPQWLPACTSVEASGPVKRGARLTVHFGDRETEFEIVELTPPTNIGWEEREGRSGSKTFIHLEAVGKSTTRVTIRHLWAPLSFLAWWRGRVLVKRRVERTLSGILRNVRTAVAT